MLDPVQNDAAKEVLDRHVPFGAICEVVNLPFYAVTISTKYTPYQSGAVVVIQT
jgi:hypothetical protein